MTEQQDGSDRQGKQPHILESAAVATAINALPTPLKLVVGIGEFIHICQTDPAKAKQIIQAGGLGFGCVTVAATGVVSELVGGVSLGVGAVANLLSPGAGEGATTLGSVCCVAPIILPGVAALLANPRSRNAIVNGVVTLGGKISGATSALKDRFSR